MSNKVDEKYLNVFINDLIDKYCARHNKNEKKREDYLKQKQFDKSQAATQL